MAGDDYDSDRFDLSFAPFSSKVIKNRTIVAGIALCLGAGLHGTHAPLQSSSYERLGGMPAIRAVRG